MKLKLLFTLLIFTNILWINPVEAQPANDNFSNAIPISCGNNYTSSTAEATLDEDNAPDSTTPAVDLDAPNIWYSYTGNGTPEIITLDLCASGYDTSYLVYAGVSGNLNLVAANDDNETQCGPGYRSYGTFQSDGLTTYYITITGYGPSDIGAVDLNISCQEVVPTPNTIASAIPIVPSPAGTGCANGYTFDLDFTAATGTTDSGLGGCLNGDFEGIDQFFTWTATTNGLKYSTPSFVGRAGMIIRNASTQEIIDCSKALDNNDGIFTGWNVGDNLIIQIYKSEGFSGIENARFCLEEKGISPPNNDFPTGAFPITPGLPGSDCSITMDNQTLFLNTNDYTTTDSGMDNCVGENTGVDQFFTWTATSGGLLWGQNPDNIGISVRSTTGVEYGCIVTNQGDPVKLSGWEIGEDLIIQLFNYENYHYDSLTFCLREYETPTNNIISGAIPIVPTSLQDNCDERALLFSSDGTTDSGLDGTCNGENTGYDQFFTWTATTNALAWTGLSENPGIIIRDAQGNEITCADTIAADNTILSGWEVGDELIIQIYDWVFIINSGTAAGNVEDSYRDVSFCLQEHVIQPPALTHVPDDNFEQALIDLGYDDILDDYVLTGNINTITILDVSDKNIADLTGIEDFTSLEELDCQANGLTSLNVSQNLALKELRCGNGPAVVDNPNQITSLDVSQNINLEILHCDNNPLNTLDVSLNTNLVTLDCLRTGITDLDVSLNTNLESLTCGYNNLTSLDISQNTLLRFLYVINSQLTTLNVSNNQQLQYLYAGSNPLTSIDVSVNTGLTFLWVDNTQLTNLNLSNNPLMERLFSSGISELTSLNIANGTNESIITFRAFNNPNLACIQVDDPVYSTANWTSIGSGTSFSADCNYSVNDECVDAINIPISDASCGNAITGTMQYATDSNSLHCFGNDANFSDVWFSFVATEETHQITLQNLTGTPNFLWHSVIDAQTYNCSNITDAILCNDGLSGDATGLTIGNTYYIQVYSHEANANTTFDICVASLTIPGQTYVPDDNFEQALIDLGYDITLDNYVTTTNISGIENLDVISQNISDLTGIEDFAALKDLRCGNNNIANLDISQNVLLTHVHANDNALTNFDLTQNTALEQVFISGNQLTDIDVSQNAALVDLGIFTNPQLSSIDVSANPNLKTLNISYTLISDIDVSNNLALERLSFVNCPITEIDVTANLELRQLSTSQSLVTSVDVSGNPFFEWISCRNSPLLTKLNMQNGNNMNVVFFLATDTPNLTCIQVDDAAYSTANWTNITTGTSFSTDCGYSENDECVEAIAIPISDATCNSVISATMVGATNSNSLQCFGNNANFADVWFSFVATETTHEITLQNLTGSPNFLWHALIDAQTYTCGNITDAIYCTDGLENTATGLTVGDTYYIQVYSHVANANTTFDICVSTNTIPGQTYVPDDNFEQALIDFGYDIVLDDYVTTTNINMVTSLDISNKNISDLTGIEGFAVLEILNATSNTISTANLGQNSQLQLVLLQDNNLTELDITQNSLLENITLEENSLTTIDVTQNLLLEYLNITDNAISSVNVTQNSALISLDAKNNMLNNIDVSQNPALAFLTIDDNSISSLDVTNNPILRSLSTTNNSLSEIDLSQNPALVFAYFGYNQLPSIDVSQNPILEVLNIEGNTQISSVDVAVNAELKTLRIGFTQISGVNVSNNLNLENLSILSCPITVIDVTANVALRSLGVIGSQISNIDVSQNPAFVSLFCSNTSTLNTINIQNGNNTNVTTFIANNTPNLTCVQVDNVAYSTTNWTNVDVGINFSTTCGFPVNNTCVNAVAVPISNATCNMTVTGTLVEATNSNGFNCFGSTEFSDVWFSFIATETMHNIKILNTSGANARVFHAVIDAQTYTCGNITDAIYCTDADEGQATNLTIGNTYFVQVYTDVVNSTETFDICISTNSIPGRTFVPDNNFEQALIDLGLDDVLDDYVTTANINTVNDLNIRNLSIFDLTGIEDFAGLEILNCGLNSLGELDLSNNTNLNYLIADNAGLVALNVQNGNNANVTTFITLGNVDLFCIQVDDATYSTENWTIIESTTSFSEFCGAAIQVAAKVYLQGAMLNNTDGFMRTDLKDNNLVSDASSPYADGIAASDNVFFALEQDKIVDWVWVELRDANDATIIIDGKSAMLQRDGDIVAAEGDATTPVSFNQASGNYYVVIKHRNHLGIMSNTAISLSSSATIVDFTDRNNQITYGANAQTNFGMPADVVGMWTGNVNGDTVIQYSGTTPDAPAILSKVLNDPGNFLNFPTYVVIEYDSNDINMDGTTQYTGTNPDTPFILQNILTHPGNFLNFSTYQITEKLPENE
ncbi:hypothetical protein [uncultured Kordia sp.]|uniref:hypothetical protein n=1 Tax=uncultured Kordia sp. TaxID=507699 RepID=UPI00262E4066|nr:hypothetical protein [uncultured Kordia sp.]